MTAEPDDDLELSPEDQEWVVRLVEGWGPLAEEHREFLARMFHKRP